MLLVALLAFAACSGATVTSTVATAPAARTSSTAGPALALAPAEDAVAERALEHVRVLSQEIGPRPAGSPQEQRAAEYIRGQLEQAGYQASFEPFTVSTPRDDSAVTIEGGGDQGFIRGIGLAGTVDGVVTARLVAAGIGRPEDFAGVDARGAIALVDRGRIPFGDKALAAQRAGAIAVVVANNAPGLFGGTLGDSSITIPVIGVSSEDASLLDPVAAGGARVTVTVKRTIEPFESRNVVGKPSDAPCTAYLGAHYDSVPQAPGANDNASGTAALIELARTHRTQGLCVVAFGSEELGLFGSKAYVDAHEVSDARFMLNFDMVGKRTGAEFVVSASDPPSERLAARASNVTAAIGDRVPPGHFPPFASSDHVSFSQAGVPAFTVYSGDDEFIHRPQDTFDNVRLEDLRSMLRLSQAVLRDLLTEKQG